ncbi:MAG: carboxypeptidase regulatory-like domain-containing protein [Actinomycetota bacterium]|nr:carboxypeptidase regulatory-like domain-containing protein [Actinomycetota bacterium]
MPTTLRLKSTGMWIAVLAILMCIPLVCPSQAAAVVGAAGTVRNADTSAVIAGMEVGLYYIDASNHYEEWDYTTTNASGYYSFSSLESGKKYAVFVNEWGYDEYESAPFTYSGTLVTHNFSLTPWEESISGSVTDDDTSAPIEGADLLLYFDNGVDFEEWDWADSDAAGHYSFYELDAGDYYVEASAWGYWGADSPVLAYNGIDKIDRDFSLVPLDPLTADSYEVDNTPAMAKTITLGARPQSHSLFPAGDVDYMKIDVTEGTAYTFEVGDSDTGWWWPWSLGVKLYGSDGTTLIKELGTYSVWKAPADGTVYIKVFTWESGDVGAYTMQVYEAQYSGGGIITEAGVGDPVEGATVILEEYDAGDDEWWGVEAVSTYADGTFEFYNRDAVEGSGYQIYVEKRGWIPATSSPFPYNGVEPFYEDLEITKDTPSAKGVVKNATTGLPLAGVQMTLYEYDDEYEDYWGIDSVKTDAAGFYDFYQLEPSTKYKIAASAKGYIAQAYGFTYAGTPITKNFSLSRLIAARLSSATRYSTAVKIAREGFDPMGDGSWSGISDIVIASGENRAAADPLAASGLCWAYDAPLFLVQGGYIPDEVWEAIDEIVAMNDGYPVTVHLVGGPASVPNSVFAELLDWMGPGSLVKHRLATKGDRYDLAAAIAVEMRAVAGGEVPDAVLVANGGNPDKFFDALALSPIASGNGYPILLVKYDSIPSATQNVINAFKPGKIIVGGGAKTVNETVRKKLGAERWSGASRYSTAITIADKAIAKGWLSDETVGIAAMLPDALTGGSMVGRESGVLLLTRGDALTIETGAWLTRHKANIKTSYVFGGPKSISEAVRKAIAAKLK